MKFNASIFQCGPLPFLVFLLHGSCDSLHVHVCGSLHVHFCYTCIAKQLEATASFTLQPFMSQSHYSACPLLYIRFFGNFTIYLNYPKRAISHNLDKCRYFGYCGNFPSYPKRAISNSSDSFALSVLSNRLRFPRMRTASGAR